MYSTSFSLIVLFLLQQIVVTLFVADCGFSFNHNELTLKEKTRLYSQQYNFTTNCTNYMLKKKLIKQKVYLIVFWLV